MRITRERLDELLAMARELGSYETRLARAETEHEHARDKRHSYERLRRARQDRDLAAARLEKARRRLDAAQLDAEIAAALADEKP